MSSIVLKKLMTTAEESNLLMRKQLKEQQMSLNMLEKQIRQRKMVNVTQRQNQLKIPPGKMVCTSRFAHFIRNYQLP